MRQQEKLSSLESYTIKQQVKYEQYQKQYGEAYGILVEKYSQKIMEATSKKQESVIQKIDPVHSNKSLSRKRFAREWIKHFLDVHHQKRPYTIQIKKFGYISPYLIVRGGGRRFTGSQRKKDAIVLMDLNKFRQAHLFLKNLGTEE